MPRRFLFIRGSQPYQYLKDKFLYVRSFIQYKLNSYPKEVGDNPIFIFNHIPKCGGTSLNIVLRKWFLIKRDYAPSELKNNDSKVLESLFLKFDQKTPELNKMKPWELIAGHYHLPRFSLERRISDIYSNPNVKSITFLREPLEQRISMYNYATEKGHPFVKGLSLEDYIFIDKNFIATTLNCNEENYKDILGKYFFVGILEKYDFSVKKLANKLGKNKPEIIPKVNVSNQPIENNLLPKEKVLEFNKLNNLDYLIYNYTLENLIID